MGASCAKETVARLAEWVKEYHLSDVEFIVKNGETPLHTPMIGIYGRIGNGVRVPDMVSLDDLRSEALARGWTERK
jgi:hypothetical protein